MEINRILTILRNPYGFSQVDRRAVYLEAADLIERNQCTHGGSTYTEWRNGKEIWLCCYCEEEITPK